MPSLWNLPRSSNLWDIQDVEQFTRYQLWNAEQSTKRIEFWGRWQKKYGKIKWRTNFGDIMQGVMAENSAIAAQKHVPRNITEVPLKTQVRHFERTNQGRVKRHLWESPQFHFLPSFRDFRRTQIEFAAKDLDKQIAVGNDNFVRWQALQQCRFAWVCGAAQPLQQVVYGEATDTSEPKTTAWFQEMAAMVGSDEAGFLTYKQVQAAVSDLKNAVGAPPWEDMKSGTPKENETAKGKYILTGDSLIYDALPYDKYVLDTKSYVTDFLNTAFRGMIGTEVAFLQERYPLRYVASDGSFPAPEIEELVAGSTNKYQTIPNPPYAGIASTGNADIGIAFLEGYQPFESIEVGAPPREFASGAMSMKKYAQLKWNGEVRLTDDVLINYGSNVYDTNKYGEYLQLIADTTMGIVPNTARNLMAIIFRLNRHPSLTTAF